MNAPNWFAAMLSEAASARNVNGRGGVARVAEMLNEPRPNIDRWIDGANAPDLFKAARIIEVLGGDLSRALPGWTPSPDALTAPILGTVAGGALDWTEELPDNPRMVPAWPAVWKTSPLWKLSTAVTVMAKTSEGLKPQRADFVLFRVVGDSMDPLYRDGELVVCRTPLAVENLPDGTPCIFNVRPEGQTLKLLRRANDGTREGAIYGEPVNRAHMTVLFRKSRALRIPFVVVSRYDIAESEIKNSRKRRVEYDADAIAAEG